MNGLNKIKKEQPQTTNFLSVYIWFAFQFISEITGICFLFTELLILFRLQRDLVLKLWKNGFSIDDGPLRDFKDPQNKEFLDAIHKG